MLARIDGEDIAVAQTQAEVFEKSCHLGLDSEIFIREYMNSECAWLLDLPHHKIRWNGKEHLLSQFIAEKEIPHGDTWDKDAMFWIGYVYRIWHSLTNQSSKEIYDTADANVMLVNFPKMHMDNVNAAVMKLASKKGIGQENSFWGAFPKDDR